MKNKLIPTQEEVKKDVNVEPNQAIQTKQDLSITELQRKFAIQNPRQLSVIHNKILNELKEFPKLAETFFYSIPYTDYSEGEAKTVYVEGLTIKAAMTILRYWQNCATMTAYVGEDDTKVFVEGGIYDFETNTLIKRSYTVPKTRYDKRTKTVVPINPSKLVADIQAGMSKALRNVILSVVPDTLKIELYQHSKTLAAKNISGGKKSLQSRVSAMFQKFAEIGISKEQILAYLKKKSEDEISEEDIGNMLAVYNGITQEGISPDEYFGKKEEKKPEKKVIDLDELIK